MSYTKVQQHVQHIIMIRIENHAGDKHCSFYGWRSREDFNWMAWKQVTTLHNLNTPHESWTGGRMAKPHAGLQTTNNIFDEVIGVKAKQGPHLVP